MQVEARVSHSYGISSGEESMSETVSEWESGREMLIAKMSVSQYFDMVSTFLVDI